MAVARGDEPADLVLSGGHVLSVFTKEWLDVDVAVKDGHVVGLGRVTAESWVAMTDRPTAHHGRLRLARK
jgi:adenine deaminase